MPNKERRQLKRNSAALLFFVLVCFDRILGFTRKPALLSSCLQVVVVGFLFFFLINIALLLYSPPGSDLSKTQPVGKLLAAEERQMTVYWS